MYRCVRTIFGVRILQMLPISEPIQTKIRLKVNFGTVYQIGKLADKSVRNLQILPISEPI